MAKRKEKRAIYCASIHFLFWDVWMFPDKIIEIQKKIEKKEKKEKGKVGNTYTSYFLFCHTGVLFFVILHLCRSLDMYFFCKEGSAWIKKKRVQVYCIGDKNKDL